MDRIIGEQTDLAEITCREVEKYAGDTHNAVMYPILDEKNQRYGVVIIPENDTERPAYMAVLAHIVDDYVIVDEDGTIDKPLVEALMVNGGIPREKIILAYKGEKLPATK